MYLAVRIKKGKVIKWKLSMVFCNMREQERKKRNTKYRQVSVSFCNKTNISHAKQVRLYKDETKPYSDLTVYFICFKTPCKKVNRTVCKFFVNCHSAKPFLSSSLLFIQNKPFSLKSKQAQWAVDSAAEKNTARSVWRVIL